MYDARLKLHLFPLSILDTFMSGYLMCEDGSVYSTKTSDKPVRLNGSVTPSGRYYTLNKRTYRADDLLRRAKAHSRFHAETSSYVCAAAAAAAPKHDPAPVGRTKSARQAASVKGFMLATIGVNDKLIFGTEPMLHLSDVTAKAEAERIAVATGQEVVLLQIVGKVKMQKAVWE